MKIASSTTLLGITLAVALFGAGVITERLTSVYITNFPLDEQGNLRISVSERQPQRYTDVIGIPVQDWTELSSYEIQYGIPVVGHEVAAKFPFAFSPKQIFQNTTRIVVSLTLKASHTQWKANVTLNGKKVQTEFQPAYQDYPTVVSVYVDNSDILQTVTSGVNTIIVEDAIFFDTYSGSWREGYIWIFRVTTYIEYEYLA